MADNKESNRELFAAWLAQNAPADQLSDLYLSCERIEAYCIKTKVLRKSLFETTDLDTVKKVQKAVDECRVFRYSNTQRRMLTAAAKYYADFVKSLSAAEAPRIAPPVPPVKEVREEEAPADNDKSAFDRFFDDPKYKLLYEKLKEKNITTLEDLKKINLGTLMNYYQLYPVKQRVEIRDELDAKLRDVWKKENKSEYIIYYNGVEYKGGSPSEAFVA